MQRRHFLKTAAAGSLVAATPLLAKKKSKLKIATSWPARFPIMGTGIEAFAQQVEAMSDGEIQIKVYPAGMLVPALQVFDAASKGIIDGFHSGPYYWKGKNPAFSLFTGFPFGMLPDEQNAWLTFGGGLELWRKLYAQHDLYPLPGGSTGPQMGGWFRKPIRSLKDLQGLKMRIPGLGGEVMAKLGVNPVLMAAGEIYTALERGTIDATEWIAPDHDLRMGFDKVAPYYYSGWHEPGSTLEVTFNKGTWEKLPKAHQAIIETAAVQLNSRMLSEFQAANAQALKKLDTKKVTVGSFPDDVVAAAREAMDVVIAEQVKGSKDFAMVWESCSGFLKETKVWTDLSTKAFLAMRG